MELYQLKTFVAVAEEGHLTRAALSLNTSQPAVSAHIKALEEELDLVLFNRTPKGMILTSGGENLLIQARRILQSVHDIKLQAAREQSQPRGQVRCGLNIDPVFLRFDSVLSHSLTNYPELEYHLVHNMSWEAFRNVASGKIDCAFVYGAPEGDRLSSLPITSFDVVVAVPYEWRDKINKADWKHIGNLPWIMTPKICGFSNITRQNFEREKIDPATIAVADEEQAIRRLVLSGVGAALMIKEEALPLEKEKRIAIWDHDVGEIPLNFVYLKSNEQSPLIMAVIESVKSVWQINGK